MHEGTSNIGETEPSQTRPAQKVKKTWLQPTILNQLGWCPGKLHKKLFYGQSTTVKKDFRLRVLLNVHIFINWSYLHVVKEIKLFWVGVSGASYQPHWRH